MLPFRFGYNSSSSTRRLNNGPSAPLSVHRLWLQNPKAHQLVTKKDIDVSDHRFIRALDLRASSLGHAAAAAAAAAADDVPESKRTDRHEIRTNYPHLHNAAAHHAGHHRCPHDKVLTGRRVRVSEYYGSIHRSCLSQRSFRQEGLSSTFWHRTNGVQIADVFGKSRISVRLVSDAKETTDQSSRSDHVRRDGGGSSQHTSHLPRPGLSHRVLLSGGEQRRPNGDARQLSATVSTVVGADSAAVVPVQSGDGLKHERERDLLVVQLAGCRHHRRFGRSPMDLR